MKYQKEAIQKCVLVPGCHSPVVSAYSLLFVSHHLISAQASLGMAKENAFSQNKFSISTLDLLQESCEMQLIELGKIQIEGIFRGPCSNNVLQAWLTTKLDQLICNGGDPTISLDHVQELHDACVVISALFSQKFSWIESN